MSIESLKASQSFSALPPAQPAAPLKTTVLNEDQKARLKAVFQVRFTYNSPAGLFTGNLLSFIGTFMRSGQLYHTRSPTWNLDCAKAPGFNDRKWVHISNIDPFTIVESRELSRWPKSKFVTECGIQGLFLKGGVVRHVLFNVPLSGRDLDLSAAIEDLGDKQCWKNFGDSFLQHTAEQIICGNKHEIKGMGLDGKLFDEKGRSLLMQLPMEMKGIAKSIDVDFAAVGSSTPFARQHSCDSSYGCFYIDLAPALKGNWDQEFSVIAMDGYDLAASMQLTGQRRFYIQAGAGKTLFQGIRKYCDHLTRGIIADSGRMDIPQTEKDFCESVLKMVEGGHGPELGSYLKEHYNNDIPSQILFLINYHDIFQRSGLKNAKVEQEICALLTQILGLKEIPKNISELLSVCKAYLYLAYSSEGHDEFFVIAENRKGHFLFCEDSTGLKKKRGLVIEASLAAIRETIAHIDHEIVKNPFIASFYSHFTQKTDLYIFCKNELGQRLAFLQRSNVSVAQLLPDLRAFIDHYSHARGIFSVETIAGQLLLFMTKDLDIAIQDKEGLIENIDRIFNQLMRKEKGQLAEQLFKALLKHPALLNAGQKQSFAKRFIGFLIKREKKNGFERSLNICGMLMKDKDFGREFFAPLADLILKALPGQKLKGFEELYKIFPSLEKKSEESKAEERDRLSSLIEKLTHLTQAYLDGREPSHTLTRIMSSASHLSEEELRSLHIVLCEQEGKLNDVKSGYTERDSIIGFGLMRKLSRFNHRKLPNIRNMGQLTMVEPRGFGTAEIPILESRSVYLEEMFSLHLKLLFKISKQSESGQESMSWPVQAAYNLMKSDKLQETVLIKYWNFFAPVMFSHTNKIQTLYEIYSAMSPAVKGKLILVFLKHLPAVLEKGDICKQENWVSLYSIAVNIFLAEGTKSPSLMEARVDLLGVILRPRAEDFSILLGRLSHGGKIDFKNYVFALREGIEWKPHFNTYMQQHRFFEFWDIIDQGDEAYHEEDYANAISHYRSAIKSKPASESFMEIILRDKIVDCFYALGDERKIFQEIYFAYLPINSIGRIDDSERKALLVNILKKFGHIFVEYERYDEALMFLKDASDLDPKDLKVIELQAGAYFGKKNYKAARVCYNLLLKEAPGELSATVGLAKTLSCLKEFKEAVILYRAALQCTTPAPAGKILIEINREMQLALDNLVIQSPFETLSLDTTLKTDSTDSKTISQKDAIELTETKRKLGLMELMELKKRLEAVRFKAKGLEAIRFQAKSRGLI